MVGLARVGASSLSIALLFAGGCSRVNPAYGLDEGAGDGSSDDAGDEAPPADGAAEAGDGKDDGDGGDGDADGTGDAESGGALDDTGGDTTGGGRGTTSDGGSGDEAGTGGSDTGEPLAEPEAITLFAGPVTSGRIEFDGKLGYDAATEACVAAAATGATNACAETVVAVLATGSPKEGAVDFAAFLGVVPGTPVRGPSGAEIAATAEAFFDGTLELTLVQASVFPAQTHIWSGFDPDQLSGNCEDWTVNDIDAEGGVGDSTEWLSWSSTGNFSCALTEPILCACW